MYEYIHTIFKIKKKKKEKYYVPVLNLKVYVAYKLLFA